MVTRAVRGEGERVRITAPAAPAPAAPERVAAATVGITDLLLKRMAGVVLSSGVGVVRGGTGRGPRWANDAFLAMSGHDADTLAALDWAAIAPDGLPTAPAVGEIAPIRECALVRRDGSAWPAIVSRGVDPVDAGQIILFVVDLTETRVAEATRRAADRRFARFFEIAGVAFWTADAAGRVKLLSPGDIVRIDSGPRRSATEWVELLLHPDDRVAAMAAWTAAVASGDGYDFETRLRPAVGAGYRWMRMQAVPEIEGGRTIGWYGITEDIHDRRVAADALAESEQRFKRLSDDIPVMVWLTDDSGATYLSKSWYEFTGQTEIQALGGGWMDAVLREDLPRLEPIMTSLAAGTAFDLDFRLLGADGSRRWMMSSGRPRHDAAGRVVGFVGTLTDIHARKVAESELADAQLRLSRALDGTGVGVWEWDATTDKVSVSGSAFSITGHFGDTVDYREVDYRAAIHPDDRTTVLTAMTDYIDGRSSDFVCEVRLRHRDGSWVWVLDRGTATARDADGRATRMVGTLTNIDVSKRAAEQLRWTVEHDTLTGLANREHFHNRLAAALGSGEKIALALLDLDEFKSVNDRHGHAAGDALLAVLARRLLDFAYPGETVARLGGDEFTLIVTAGDDCERLMARFERLQAKLSAPFQHNGMTLSCRCSIGVALAPDHGGDPATLLGNADLAMYEAKRRGQGAVGIYEPELGALLRGRTARADEIRAALAAGSIEACYEPVERLADRHVVGYEVHGRLAGDDGQILDVHDDAGIADPDLAVKLGDRLVELLLADFARWEAAGIAPEFLTTNVALAELSRADYAPRLLSRLAAHGLDPARLRLEIVEPGQQAGRGAATMRATLAALKAGGVRVGLDNFGAGAASLLHLTTLPLAAVKIDRRFVAGVATPGPDQTVVRAIVGLAQSFELRSVGIGVETAAQADALAALGCTYAQGPLYGAHTDAAATERRLRG